MPNLQGFLDGFQTVTTFDCLATDTVISFPTAGFIPGLQYHVRIDDTNPPTTFEYAAVEFQDAGTAHFVAGGAGRGIGGSGPAAFHPLGSFITCVLLRESLLPTFARLDTQNQMAFSSASVVSGLVFDPYGIGNAVAPTRYVGGTTGGAPTSGGPFVVGDFVLDSANNVIWICTSAGSPGTWQNILGGTNTGLDPAASSLTRWAGATGGGSPLTGTWKQGDIITDRSGTMWICTFPGTPGQWMSLLKAPVSGTIQSGVANAIALLSGTRTVTVNNQNIPIPYPTAPQIFLTIQNLNVIAAAERPISIHAFAVTGSLFSFAIDSFINVASNRSINVGWMAFL